jgi:Na+/H+ antiporter NhaD/arsenite permease-like protein
MVLASILILALMFLVASRFPVNMGLMGVVAAFGVGLAAGLPSSDIVGGFPSGLFLTLVGITYLFAVAHANGTIDRIIAIAVAAVRGRVWAIPWIMFASAAVLTAFGAVSPAAVAILAPIALGFAAQYRINPMLMGLMVVHGAQAGGFSPISVYGGITNRIVAEAGLPLSPLTTFSASLAMNTVAAVILFLVLCRAKPAVVGHAAEDVAALEAGVADRRGTGLEQALTIAGLLAVAVATLGFGVEIGFSAIAVGLLLSMFSISRHAGALSRIPWPEVVLVMGVGLYVAVLDEIGVIDTVGGAVAGLGQPLAAALLLCVVGAVVSAFASSVAVLGSLIPLAVPLLLSGAGVDAVGFIAAMAVASTIVDVSPFSTNGALVLANAQGTDKTVLFRQLMLYGAIVTVAAPLVVWALLVLPR